jgi:ribosome maturation factor RimP
MSHIDPIRQRVIDIASPVCAAAGYELVDVRFKSEQGGWTLRVFIDIAPEEGSTVDLAAVPEDLVDLNDCEEISRELSAVLDVEDPVPHAYSLEVSSPGIDRPLRTPAHFRRYVGADIRVAMGVPLGERRNFKGRLSGVEGDDHSAVAIIDVDGQPFRLPVADIDTARIVPDWDAVLKGGSGVGPAPAPARKPHPKHLEAQAKHAEAQARKAAKAANPAGATGDTPEESSGRRDKR